MLVHLHRSFFIALGGISIVLGVIGIFLPLLPTTPFLLLSAYCFSKSSPRLHKWLLSNPYLGPIINDWEQYGVIKLRIKWSATIVMLLLISYPIVFMIEHNGLRTLIGLTMMSVLIFIWSRPSVNEKKLPDQDLL